MVQVKICGITNLADARAAVDAGADLLGFVFYPPSPRYIAPERARETIAAVRCLSSVVQFVGVFVNESLENVNAVMECASLDLAQLHGQEAPEMLRALEAKAYKALQARDTFTARQLTAQYRSAANGNIPAFIADAPPAQLPGGNGVLADWSVARAIAREFPILLAGGLTVENVRAAINAVNPWGVDVSSGVERAPGLKDHWKVREFIARVRG